MRIAVLISCQRFQRRQHVAAFVNRHRFLRRASTAISKFVVPVKNFFHRGRRCRVEPLGPANVRAVKNRSPARQRPLPSIAPGGSPPNKNRAGPVFSPCSVRTSSFCWRCRSAARRRASLWARAFRHANPRETEQQGQRRELRQPETLPPVKRQEASPLSNLSGFVADVEDVFGLLASASVSPPGYSVPARSGSRLVGAGVGVAMLPWTFTGTGGVSKVLYLPVDGIEVRQIGIPAARCERCEGSPPARTSSSRGI